MHPQATALALTAGPSFVGFEQVVTSSPGVWQQVNIPPGATSATLEAIGAGANGQLLGPDGDGEYTARGGRGAGYSRRNSISLSGVASLWLFIAADGSGGRTQWRANSSSGTVLCTAAQDTVGEVGDVRHAGGLGYEQYSSNFSAAGGAAGRTGPGGGAAGPNTGGIGVSPGGNGGNPSGAGPALYGGGGDVSGGSARSGRQGWAAATWA